MYECKIKSLPICCAFPTDLGDGPYALFSAIYNDTMFGVNRSSSLVFPLTRPPPGTLPAPGLLFNFMVTTGLQKDPKSRELSYAHCHLQQSV